MKQYFDVYTQASELYNRVFVTGKDEAECEAGINAYLSTKQDCYALASEDQDAQESEDM